MDALWSAYWIPFAILENEETKNPKKQTKEKEKQKTATDAKSIFYCPYKPYFVESKLTSILAFAKSVFFYYLSLQRLLRILSWDRIQITLIVWQ